MKKRKDKTQDAKKEFLDTFISALKEGRKSPSDKVQDALALLKDSKHKRLLLSVVTECFNAPKVALENKDILLKVIEKAYKAAVKDSINDIECGETKSLVLHIVETKEGK